MSNSVIGEPNLTKTNNLRLVKKVLVEPAKFRELDYADKACFSYNYKKYGFFESWDIALNILNNLPSNENIFNELLLDTSKVKPYLDIEWLKSDYSDLLPDYVKTTLREKIVEIFKKDFNVDLTPQEILFAECHRPKNGTTKYSFHIVVNTNPAVVFLNTNYASVLPVKLKHLLSGTQIDKSIIDLSVYKKTQNFRMIGHTKLGENAAFAPEIGHDAMDYLVTNVGDNCTVIETNEQKDYLYRNIKNIKKVDFMQDDTIEYEQFLEKIKLIHPTAELERYDAGGFFQFNYRNRDEPCFTNENKQIKHDRIGFFAYIYDNLICLGCHSGNCVDANNKKIIKVLGSLNTNKNLTFEKVDYDNTFEICHSYVEDCVINGALGISNLFQRMYLSPKRIKWINDTRNGISYFWDGKLWQEDDYCFIERLMVTTVVRVLRTFVKTFRANSEISSEEAEEKISYANKMIVKLNDGILLHNVIKFIKPLIRDTEFSAIKDVHPHFLSCKNGMVNLTSGELRPSVPDDNITKNIDIVYDENADFTEFDCFVKQITSNERGPDADLYNYLRWCLGYAIQGNPKKKIFIILYGPYGFNGKSLLMNTISDILEYYSATMDKSVVLEGPKKTAGSHSTELFQLENCRFGILSDTKEDAAIDDGQMKQLTGITDKLSGREIFGKQREFIPRFVPFISTNHTIQMNLTDKAMYERLIIIPFLLSFVDNPNPKRNYERKADNSLADNFKKNKQGILKWLVDCGRYYHEDPDKDVPRCIVEAKEMYNKQVNTYLDFIDKYIIFDADSSVRKIELLQIYKGYIRDNGGKYTANVVEREFDKIYKSEVKKNVKHYLGIRIREEEETDELSGVEELGELEEL
jgi:P4 family phage/plasmid primase-like protien